MSLDGAVPGVEVLPAARGLLVEGFQLNLCNADLRLFSPEGFRHMVEDSAWLTRGGAIFFLLASLIQFALMIFAMRLDKKRNPVLVKINRIREVSSKDYYEDDGNDPMEGLPAYEDFKKQQSHKGLRNQLNNLTSRKLEDMKEMHVEDVTDKSWQWLVQIFARHALRYAFKWKMASLEPGAFQYITQDEFRADASVAVTEFVLLPHEQHIFIFLMTSSRFTSAFLANYKLSRLERFTSFAVVLLSSVAMIVVVFHWLGYFGGHTAGADVPSECQNSGRGSTVQFFEELCVSFGIYFFNELLLAVAVRIRGDRFLLSKAIVYDEWSWSPICRLGVYVMFMFLLYLCSVFVVLHFLATATEDDVDHCFLFMAIIFGFAVVVKPLLICTSLMAFWMASQTWKAGAVTQEMVSMLYIADKRPNTLSAKDTTVLEDPTETLSAYKLETGSSLLLLLENPGPIVLQATINDRTASDDPLPAARSKELAYSVSSIEVSATCFKDQDWGNAKSALFLTLKRGDGDVLLRKNLYGTYRGQDYPYGQQPPAITFTESDDMVSLAEPGCFYQMEYRVGHGGGHKITVEDWVVKISFVSSSCTEPSDVVHFRTGAQTTRLRRG